MRRIYIEKPVQQVPAVQFTGGNAAEVVEFDPDVIRLGGTTGVQIKAGSNQGWLPIPVNDWVMDDPTIGFTSCVTDEAFQARFNI